MFLAIKIALFCLLVNFILVGYNFLKRWYTKKFKMTFVGKVYYFTYIYVYTINYRLYG